MPNAQENGQLMLPPPPVFAASSSSAVASPSKAGLVEQPGEEKARGKKGRSNVDEKDDDDEWAGEPPSKSKARPRKKARVDDDEAEWEGDVPVKATRKPRRKGRGEREDDEDWTGDAPSKAKPKAPPRKRGKKNKVEQKQVEVVIDAPKAGKGPKDQAKTKAPTSRESAADFDGEDYSMLMPPPQVLPSDVPHGPELADIEVPSAEPDSEHTGNTRAVGAKKGGGSPASFVGPEPQLLKKVSPSNGTRDATDGNSAVAATKNKGKKRTVILSDDEDEGEGASSHGSPPKRRKGRKSAPAVLSRDDRQSNEEDGPSDAIKVESTVDFVRALTADRRRCRKTWNPNSPIPRLHQQPSGLLYLLPVPQRHPSSQPHLAPTPRSRGREHLCLSCFEKSTHCLVHPSRLRVRPIPRTRSPQRVCLGA